MWQAIAGGIGGLISPITEYFARRRELKLEEHRVALEMIKAEGDRKAQLIREGLAADMQWEQAMVEQAGTGWKDEVTFLLVAIPFVLVFIPGWDETIASGFAAIEKMPQWYVLLATTIFFANYGIRFWRRSQYDTDGTQTPNKE